MKLLNLSSDGLNTCTRASVSHVAARHPAELRVAAWTPGRGRRQC